MNEGLLFAYTWWAMGLFFAAYCAAGAGLLSHYRLSYSQALSPGKKNEELALYLVNLIFLMVPEKPKQKPRGFGKVFTIVLLVFHIYFSWWIYKKKLVADRKKPVIVEQVTYLVSHAVTMGFLDSKVFQNVKAAIDGKQTLTFSTPIGFTKTYRVADIIRAANVVCSSLFLVHLGSIHWHYLCSESYRKVRDYRFLYLGGNHLLWMTQVYSYGSRWGMFMLWYITCVVHAAKLQ